MCVCRSVFDNIQKFLQFQLTVNVVALTLTFISAVTGNEPPLNAVCMYVCMYVCIYAYVHFVYCMYEHRYVYTHVCIYVCMYYACVFMYVCIRKGIYA